MAVGGSFNWPGAGWGALFGGLIFAFGEGVTDARRIPGTPKPLGWRIIASTAPAALLGWLLQALFGAGNLATYGAVVGVVFGAIGFRLTKIALGLAIGLLIGWVFQSNWPDTHAPAVAALVAMTYRLVVAFVYRGRPEQVSIMGEGVRPGELAYVVPFESRTRQVGSGYFEGLARDRGGTFLRNPDDAGIIGDFDSLAGPTFDPNDIHPLIREFYQHTTRFHLTIIPEWKLWIMPGFWLFKTVIARPLQQANLPFNTKEAQRGVVSYIDVITLEDHTDIDIRGWVRAFADSDEAIYVGIYTTFRHDDTGYVSVGFPLPNSNITVTLKPFNLPEGSFLLKTDTKHPFPGHYISGFDPNTHDLSVLKLNNFDEEIEVYLEDGELKTDHRFFLAGIKFLTLYYAIERAADHGRPDR